MSKIVGYVRVSTGKQIAEGQSPEAQRKRIQSWAESRGFGTEPPEIFEDEGRSGGRADNRPALQSALRQVCQIQGTLVFYSLSRLARSTKDAIQIADLLGKAGANMVSLTEQIDTTTASGKAMFKLIAVFAELERDLVSERTRSILDDKRSRNERCGMVPYGKALAPDGVGLVDDAEELDLIDLVVSMRNCGWSLREIARELGNLNVPTKVARLVKDGALKINLRKPEAHAKWSHSSIQGILKKAKANAETQTQN